MVTRKKKVALAALAIATQMTGLTLSVQARDYGQYNNVPQHIRDWFKGLKNPRNGGSCCDQSIARAPKRARMEMHGKPVHRTGHG